MVYTISVVFHREFTVREGLVCRCLALVPRLYESKVAIGAEGLMYSY